MGLLRRFFRWLFWGDEEKPSSETILDKQAPQHVVKPTKKDRVKSSEVSNDIRNTMNPKDFLNDLRSIDPPSEAYKKAHNDLVQELKKLYPRRNQQK